MNIGVEHGDEEFRKQMIGRVYKNEIAIEAFDLLKKYKISSTCNFIIGYPEETRDLFFKSIELARKFGTDDINAFIFTPYHGTVLRSLCEEKGYVEKGQIVKMYYTDSMLRMPPPYLSKKEISGLLKTFVLYVKLPKKYWPDIEKCETEDPVYDDLYNRLIKLSIEQG